MTLSPLLTLHDPGRARAFYAAGLWRGETFHALAAGHAAARPGAWALRDSRRRLSWAETMRWAESLAGRLHAAGVRRGQRVAFWLPNRVESVVAFLAADRLGAVACPSLHQNYTVAEILALLERMGAAALLCQPGYGADAADHDVAAAAAALPEMRLVLPLPPAADIADPETPPWEPADAPPTAPDDNPDSVCYLAFTSGTTGTPKGVMHCDNSLLANCRDLVRDWGHDGGTILLSLSPMSHHIGIVAVGQALVAGAELVVNDPPAGMRPLDWLLETRATYVMGVPTHAMDIQADMRRRGVERLDSVRVFYMAGAPIPREVAQRFVAMGTTPQNIYGMTENSSHQYTHPDDETETIVATCGRGGAAYEVRIFDQERPDVELPVGAVGEIGGRGAALMLGYFDNQRATETSFNAGGWFLSGDLGRLDERGDLAIVGRKKDLIIRGGHNIHPARIEDLAHRHPAIEKAAAFPVPDERLGEKVCLAIIPATDHDAPDAAAVLDHLFAAGLSRYDMPEYFLVIDALPLTASGKILKRELAAWARDGRIAPAPCRFVAPDRKGG